MSDSLFQFAMLLLGAGIFPFAAYFFKRNEQLHNETQKTQALQDIEITRHAERIERNREDVATVTERVVKLEEWYPQPLRNRT